MMKLIIEIGFSKHASESSVSPLFQVVVVASSEQAYAQAAAEYERQQLNSN